VPPWGRPSWGREGGRRRKEWERQQREWEDSRRFEELESDSDEDEGVDLDYQGNEKRQPQYDDPDDSDYNEDGLGDIDNLQIAMREKEEILVARALARIRRAQELGKTNVKLTPAESEALERKLAKDRAKGRKPVVETKRLAAPKTSSKPNLTAPSSKKRNSQSSLNTTKETAAASSSRTSSRSTSSQSIPTQQQQQPQQFRRRPLPDDPNWRPRSSSSAQQFQGQLPYPTTPQDQYQYAYPPTMQGYATMPSRHMSGSPDFGYPTDQHGYPVIMPNPRGFASSSDPNLRQRQYSGSSSRGRSILENEDDEDEDLDQGVQVDVVPMSSGQGYEVVSTSASTSTSTKSAPAPTRTSGRRRGKR
jgi:PRA1 family protein 1